MFDFFVKETGDGGDLAISGNDLNLVTGYETMVYLALFSGNNNYWANGLLLAEGDDNTFASSTEFALANNVLNSQGRLNIIAAIKSDLNFIKTYVPETVIEVNASIPQPDRLEVVITINGVDFTLHWNPDISYLTYQI